MAIKTIKEFKTKWQTDIEKGVVAFNDNDETIIADRFINDEFVCDRAHINKIQDDLRKLGYERLGTGTYFKGNMINAMKSYLDHHKINY